MPDAESDQRSNRTATSAPPSVKRVLFWLGTITAILVALALTLESAERLTKDAESLWHIVVGSPIDTTAKTSPAPSSTEAASVPANQTEQAIKSPLERLVGQWSHDSSGVNIEITQANDIWDGAFGRGRIGLTYDHGANISVSYPNLSCFYYVSFLKTRPAMVWKLVYGPRNCREGAYTRAE
jgi:hypothetical protein